MGRNLNIGSRGPRISIEERYWRKAVRLGDNECWPWRGAHTRLGYAHFWDGTYTPAGYARMVEAHRWAFKYFVRDPGDLDVLHTCDVYDCTNFVRHLYAGTKVQNMRDRDTRGRGVVPDMRGFVRGQGARFTAEQVREMRTNYRGIRGEIQRLAELHDVGHQTISNIIRGRSWVE